ncbi:MAG: agmatine deiminase [Anaerolineales bacterium]|nr:agmatine deiminase [Anaerolineales bacterium]
MTLHTTTPKQDGFRMPGEFEPHAGCWLTWPYRPDVWRDNAGPAQQAYAAVAAAISQFEPVSILVTPGQDKQARALLPTDTSLVPINSDDAWLRDSGPSFLVNDAGELRGVDWGFNAYGGYHEGLYFPWDNDALVASRVLQEAKAGRYKAPITLEGGAIHVDGQGTLLTTRDCLLNPNRNPDLSQSEVELILQEYLNLEQILWLDCAVAGDETGGHIDQLACFARPGEIILSWTEDQKSPYYDVVHTAYEALAGQRDAHGRQLKIHKLPVAEPMFLTKEEAAGILPTGHALPREEGMPIADCYINFYLANGGVVVPTFNQPNDRLAMQKLTEIFPERQVVGVPAREIGIGGGLIHCITQQQPA